MLSRLQSYGVGRLLLWNKSLYQYTTTAAATVDAPPLLAHFMAAHLESLLGFSKEEAISVTRKVTFWKSSKKDPSLVINFFENLGFDKAQIKLIVSCDPRLLLYDIEKTLEPKIRVLQELGLSPGEIKSLLMNNRIFLTLGMNHSIKYAIEILRKLLGSDENVTKGIKRYAPLLSSRRTIRQLELNMELLKKIGLSDKHIFKFAITHPRSVIQESHRIEEMLFKVENQYGIPRESKMFFYGLYVLSGIRDTTIAAKFGMFRSYGLTDEQIFAMFRTYPYILATSEDKIRAFVNFFDGHGYSMDYLALRPVIFGLSLDKRVKPRFELLKVLKEKDLIKKMPQLLCFLNLTESKFVSYFLLPYKDEIPDIYQSYIESVGRQNVKAIGFA